jgi:MFS family permease
VGLGPSYWRLWTASVVSNLGDGVSLVAYPWLAGTLTRNPVAIAVVALATRLPWLLVSLPAGAIVDRADRVRLMVAMNATRAVLTGGLAVAVLTGVMTLPLLCLSAVALGIAEVLYDNAAQTILPRIVAADRLERANANLWSAEDIAGRLAGPPLGGFLIGAGLAVPFLFDAGSFAVSAALILLIASAAPDRRPIASFRCGRGPQARPVPAEAPAERGSLRSEIAEGVRWLWGHTLLRTLALLLGGMLALDSVAFATEVLFAQELLGLDARGFGLLLTASAIGGVAGAQLAPLLTTWLGAGGVLRLSVGGWGVTMIVSGLTSSPLVFGAAGVVSAALAVAWNVVTVSLRQAVIPDRLLGRVNSVYRLIGWGSMPIGAAIGGALVALISAGAGREAGLRGPFLIAGTLNLVLMAVAWRMLTTARIDEARAAGPRPQVEGEGAVG